MIYAKCGMNGITLSRMTIKKRVKNVLRVAMYEGEPATGVWRMNVNAGVVD